MAELQGTSGADVIVGTSDADVISGGDGRDRLNGGDGADVMYGGADNDYIYGDRDNDLLFGGTGNDVLVGDHGNDVIYGEDGDDGVFGGGNDDFIDGGAGNDNLNGDGGNDVIYGGLGNDRLNGGSGNDRLEGGEGDDSIDGGSGDDTIVYRVGDGADTIVGNTGTDTLQIALASADIAAMQDDFANLANWLDGQTLSSAAATGDSFTFETLGLTFSTVEVLEFMVDGELVALDDLLHTPPLVAEQQTIATSEDVAIDGVVSASDPDSRSASVSGFLAASGAAATDGMTITVGTGPAHGVVALDAASGVFTYTPIANFSGADSFDVVVTDAAGASSVQHVSVIVTPTADVPLLTVTDVVSDAASRHIQGTAGADTIYGSAGGDTIMAGAGDDVIYADADTPNGVRVALDISAQLSDTDGSESLVIQISGIPDGASLSAGQDLGDGVWQLGADDLDGLMLTMRSPHDVTLTVTATAQEAEGGSAVTEATMNITFDNLNGIDVINAGAGNDIIYGGAGTDVLDFSDAHSGVSAYLYAGFAVGDGFDSFTSIEGVIGSNYGDTLYGSDGDNIIQGGGGGDAIYAFGGNDIIDGGDGNDALYGYDGNDTISDGAGSDAVYGGDGNDTVLADGSNERDSYYGGNGVDVVDYSQATGAIEIDLNSGQVRGAAGHDHVYDFEDVVGTGYADVIEGSSGDNHIDGGAGNDIITGGRGEDILTGGAGDDTFVYSRNDIVSGRTHHGVDHITDFGLGDRLDFDDLIPRSREGHADDYIHLTQTDAGTLVSVDLGTGAGFVDVVVLDGISVCDLDIDHMLACGQIVV